MSLGEIFGAISVLVNAILDLAFFGDGLATVLGFIGVFVAVVLMWSWTQYLVTEALLDIRAAEAASYEGRSRLFLRPRDHLCHAHHLARHHRPTAQ